MLLRTYILDEADNKGKKEVNVKVYLIERGARKEN